MKNDCWYGLWLECLKLPVHWTLRYTPLSPKVRWPEAREDLMKFVTQMDKDYEVFYMENKK